MRTRLWGELTQSRFNLNYILYYALFQKKIVRCFNILLLVFSGGGLMGWEFWDYAPKIACYIIACMSLLRLLQPHLFLSDIQLAKFDSINEFYTKYYNSLEKLWFEYESNEINEMQMKNSFYEIVGEEKSINKTVNDLIKNQPRFIYKKAKEDTDLWFSKNFNV